MSLTWEMAYRLAFLRGLRLGFTTREDAYEDEELRQICFQLDQINQEKDRLLNIIVEKASLKHEL